MSVSPTGHATAAAFPDPTSPTPSQDLGQEDFLNLLITQLNNQDPMNPMESAKFTEQMAAMNTVQQLVDANTRLDGLLLGMTSLNNQSAVDMVGKHVVARGDTFQVEDASSHELTFDLAGQAESAVVTITDMDGNVVDTMHLTDLKSGEQTTTWRDAQPGDYQFSVHALDANGDSVEAQTYVAGVVEELSFGSGYPVLMIDGAPVTLDAILRVTYVDNPVPSDDSSTSSPDEASVEPQGLPEDSTNTIEAAAPDAPIDSTLF